MSPEILTLLCAYLHVCLHECLYEVSYERLHASIPTYKHVYNHVDTYNTHSFSQPRYYASLDHKLTPHSAVKALYNPFFNPVNHCVNLYNTCKTLYEPRHADQQPSAVHHCHSCPPFGPGAPGHIAGPLWDYWPNCPHYSIT